jgi:hypothetical protein
MALFDKFDRIYFDIALFLRPMRAEIFSGDFVLAEAANNLI